MSVLKTAKNSNTLKSFENLWPTKINTFLLSCLFSKLFYLHFCWFNIKLKIHKKLNFEIFFQYSQFFKHFRFRPESFKATDTSHSNRWTYVKIFYNLFFHTKSEVENWFKNIFLSKKTKLTPLWLLIFREKKFSNINLKVGLVSCTHV